jgi:predicted nucleic acid-binding protein
MTTVIVLDTSILGMITHPKAQGEPRDCFEWFMSLWARGVQFVLPEICDYELRRELLRLRSTRALSRLDELGRTPGIGYLALTTNTMLRAAQLWADARNRGHPTASPDALDADVILAAQAQLASTEGQQANSLVVATTNVQHLEWFVHAQHWRSIEA